MALINLDKHQKEHALLQLLQPKQTGANLAAELAAIGVYSAPTAAPMGGPGAGMGVCNPAYVPAGLVGLSGYADKMNANFGNYIHPASGSIMCFIPRYWYKWGTGSNGLAVNQCSIVQHELSLQDFLVANGYAVGKYDFGKDEGEVDAGADAFDFGGMSGYSGRCLRQFY